MPGIMGQPYPMEFLLTPGKVTIVKESGGWKVGNEMIGGEVNAHFAR